MVSVRTSSASFADAAGTAGSSLASGMVRVRTSSATSLAFNLGVAGSTAGSSSAGATGAVAATAAGEGEASERGSSAPVRMVRPSAAGGSAAAGAATGLSPSLPGVSSEGGGSGSVSGAGSSAVSASAVGLRLVLAEGASSRPGSRSGAEVVWIERSALIGFAARAAGRPGSSSRLPRVVSRIRLEAGALRAIGARAASLPARIRWARATAVSSDCFSAAVRSACWRLASLK